MAPVLQCNKVEAVHASHKGMDTMERIAFAQRLTLQKWQRYQVTQVTCQTPSSGQQMVQLPRASTSAFGGNDE